MTITTESVEGRLTCPPRNPKTSPSAVKRKAKPKASKYAATSPQSSPTAVARLPLQRDRSGLEEQEADE